jgi:hypothetical protein
MEEILVKYYDYKTKKCAERIVNAYSLTQALEVVREENDFKTLILSVEYKDSDNLIKSLE